MKDMTSLDASVLAVIADTVTSRGSSAPKREILERVRAMAKRVRDPELREVAEALIASPKDLSQYSEDVQRSVDALLKWVERNRRVHGPSQERRAV